METNSIPFEPFSLSSSLFIYKQLLLMNPVLRLIPLFSKQQSHLFSKQIPVFMNQSRTFTYSSFLPQFIILI